MKALTLHQPWASLVACGAKTIETRSWSTSYRGPLAIHAGVARNHWVGKGGRRGCFGCGSRFYDHLTFPVPLGAVVATCTLVDVVPITGNVITGRGDRHIADLTGCMDWSAGDGLYLVSANNRGQRHVRDIEDQRRFGDFTPGRFAWLCDDVVPLEEPVPTRGRQGLWEWSMP